MYIIGIDFGHGETSAAALEVNDQLYDSIISVEEDVLDEWNADNIKTMLLKSFNTRKDLKVKGEVKAIKSILCYDWKNKKWDIGPNDSKLKHCISDLDVEQNQYPRLAAYFKGPLVEGQGKEHHSNSLPAITDLNKELFGEFLKNAFESIIESNTIIHKVPKNYRLYVACPSEWDMNQIKEYHNFLRGMSIPCEEMIEESRAAYMSFRDTILGNSIGKDVNPGILVIDFGSSTIDFTYYGGKEPVNHGCQHGAHRVEEILFDYMISHEASAQKGYEKLTAAVDGDGQFAKTLLIYALRNRKEKFYTDLGDYEDAELEYVGLNTIIKPMKDSGVMFSAADCFGFDDGWGYTETMMEEILADYIKVVLEDFMDFKNMDGVGDVKYVILTGGASRMRFVRRLAESVYGVHKCTSKEIENGMEETLLTDDEPTFSISRGIAKYGTYRSLSDPIRNAIEHRLNATWRDFDWIKVELDALIPQIVEQVYRDKLCAIIDEWAKADSPIVSHSGNTLYDVLDDIIKEKKGDDPMQIWQHVEESKELFYENKHSLHALLRAIYDEIELKQKESRDEINSRMTDALAEKVNSQVKVLFEKYISIYFEKDKLSPDTTLPKFYDINVSIGKNLKRKLLIDLIEKVFKKINETSLCTQDKFTLNCDRNANVGVNAPRCDLVMPMKEVMDDFCEAIRVNYDVDKISTSCKNCVDEKFSEIKYKCELEPYHL